VRTREKEEVEDILRIVFVLALHDRSAVLNFRVFCMNALDDSSCVLQFAEKNKTNKEGGRLGE
jgi:hypothetical protein